MTGFSLQVDDGPFADLSPDALSPAELLDALAAGGGYFNVHTTDFGGGEVRGQLVIDPSTPIDQPLVRFTAQLDGAQEVPPAATEASGQAVLTVDTAAGTYDAELFVEEIDPANLMDVAGSPVHVHLAPAGENGPVALNTGLDSADGPIEIPDDSQNLVGTDGDDVLVGGDGDDVIDGGGGNDTVSGAGGADDLRGGAGDDALFGGSGDDLIGGGGGQDITDGGAGNDTEDFSDIGVPVVASIGGAASYQVPSGTTIVEQVVNFENFNGSANNDQLFGDANANVIRGGDGDDLLVGGDGDDELRGGLGDDTLRAGGGNDQNLGGRGSDTIDFSGVGGSVVAALAGGQAVYEPVAGTSVVDTLISIENATGSAQDDIIQGGAGANVIGGNLGDDQIFGGRGNDVLRGDELGEGTALSVTVENLLGAGGTFQTPVWIGFHDGANFDLYDRGGPAGTGLERIAEDGTVAPISAEFVAQAGDGGVDSTVFGAGGGIAPGETTSTVINVTDAQGQAFFAWATMVIPSNDAFLASPGDPLTDPVFDADGNFLGPLVVERSGSDVLDAGTEVNTEEGAAFLNQTAPNQGITENGTVEVHPGFNGSVGNPDGEPVNILSGDAVTAAGTTIDPAQADFTDPPVDPIFRITVDLLSNQGGADVIRGGLGSDTIEGGGGSDALFGGQGQDSLDGGADDDSLTGGRGIDTFVFTDGTGADEVTDFGNGDDLLNVVDFGFADQAAALAAASQDGDDVVVALDDDDRVTLLGVDLADLDEADFIVA